jgi:hypothetical protein
MALDAFTGGRVRPTVTAMRAAQNDHDGNGIGLDDVTVAWRKFGYRFQHGPVLWATLMARFRRGEGAILQGMSGGLGRFAIGRNVPHAIYVQRSTPQGHLVVNDPLASGSRAIPEADVRRFYLTGLARAGWGAGTAPGATPAASGGYAAWLDRLRGLGISTDAGHVITAAEAAKIVQSVYRFDPASTSGARMVQHLTGQTVAAAWNDGQASGLPNMVTDVQGAVASLPDAIAALPGAFGDVMARTGLVFGLVVLALLGVFLVFREPTSIVIRRVAA